MERRETLTWSSRDGVRLVVTLGVQRMVYSLCRMRTGKPAVHGGESAIASSALRIGSRPVRTTCSPWRWLNSSSIRVRTE
jgi:hypothetical protein